jgi:hypothetical protein
VPRLSSEIAREKYQSIRAAANFGGRVEGLTHRFYKYPARFSPAFVAEVIRQFTGPGDLVLDPYMGGGTTLVEALSAGRRVVGCDVNTLAAFVARVKTTTLADAEIDDLLAWLLTVPQQLSTSVPVEDEETICPIRTKNLNLPRARALKKLSALALESLPILRSSRSQEFARCVLLNVMQWALNGRKHAVSAQQFRARIAMVGMDMLDAVQLPNIRCSELRDAPVIITDSAQRLALHQPFLDGSLADLVITSPPYPGIHMLYHRWQVDGRKESPAPYWIANCLDGAGSKFYNFAGRRAAEEDAYFEQSLLTLQSVREVVRRGAYCVQMIAFAAPRTQLPKYLANMSKAGFAEVQQRDSQLRRIWRNVPSRSWHAELKGSTSSSREVVLIHRAV